MLYIANFTGKLSYFSSC